MNQTYITTVIAASLISLVPVIAIYLWVGLALQGVFRKTGEEGWKGWVPVYNTVTLLQLGGFPWWWVLFLLIPGAGGLVVYVVTIIACHRVGTRFGYGAGMTVLAALLFPVWASVLAWGRNRWVPAREAAPRGTGPQRARAVAPQADPWHVPTPTGAAPAVPPVPRTPAWVASAAAVPANSPASAEAPRPAYAPSSAPAYPAPAAAPAPAPAPAPATGPAWASTPAPAPAPATRAPAPAVADHLSAEVDPDDADLDAPVEDPRLRQGRAPFTGTVQIVPDATDDSQVGPRRAAVPDESDDVGDAAGGEAPIREVPAWHRPEPAENPWAPPAAATPPQVRPYDPTAFSDTSGEVSAVAGAPSLGVPMSARSSVSALRQAPELPDPEDAFDETIIATRKRTPWMLVPPLGAPIPILQDVIIIGRRPSSDPDFPSAQLVSIVDETRTVSKTHARIELKETLWVVTDLDSTNGVVIIDDDGTEIEVEPRRPLPIIERFLLGDAELRFERDGQ